MLYAEKSSANSTAQVFIVFFIVIHFICVQGKGGEGEMVPHFLAQSDVNAHWLLPSRKID